MRYHKSVYFYLMRFKSGNIDDHEHEVIEARRFDIDDAIKKISFKSERGVLGKAKILVMNEAPGE